MPRMRDNVAKDLPDRWLRAGARSDFGTENAVNLRVEFQAKARKILAEVDRLNKDERVLLLCVHASVSAGD